MLKQNYQFKVTFSELKRIPLDHRQGLSKTKILRNDYIIVTLTDQNCGITESLRIWNPLPSFMLKILKNPQLWDIQYISIKLINEQAIEYDEFFCFIYLDAPVGKIMVSEDFKTQIKKRYPERILAYGYNGKFYAVEEVD